MSQIRPFKGLRPLPELAAQIASLPYDVMDTEEARTILKDNPLSFLSVTKSEATLPSGTNSHSREVYEKAKENLKKYISSGQMKVDEKPCYYLYRQEMSGHVQIGLVACASVQEYRDNVIKKHELTRHDKEQDRVDHITVTEAQTGSVFLTCRNKKEIDDFTADVLLKQRPEYDFVAEDGIRHTLYVIADEAAIAEITRLFAEVPVLYIADGHHRSAAAMRVADAMKERPGHTGEEEYNYFLAVIFPDNMMCILDYNRVVKDLCGRSEAEFLEKIQEKFVVEENTGEQKKPAKLHQFGMYLAGKWYNLTAKSEIYDDNDPVGCLDVTVLQENLLAPLLGINDPRTDERIAFIGGIRGLGELEKKVNSGEYKVAFAMYPTSMEQLMEIADSGMIMPPKSTWFEPKLRDAMVVHLIGDDI